MGGKSRAISQGQAQKVSLQFGSVYDGTVMDYDRDAARYKVRVNGQILLCAPLGPFFARMVGLQTRYIHPAGTSVKVVFGELPCVVGAYPSTEGDPTSTKFDKTITGQAGEPGGTSRSATMNPDPPSDLLEGELDLTNELGVGIRLLTTLAQLSAGGRATVEALAADELVRIVSHTFRHHSAVGDREIYDDGRLNDVEHGSSYPHEAWGMLQDGETPPELSLDPDAAIETGRWRWSVFKGYLGDMVHMFVSDPTVTLGQLASDALRSGKARAQIMSDGTVLLQSVAEIAVEKVCRVQVPVQLKNWDDPSGNVATELKNLDKQYLKIWESLKNPESWGDMAYQLRHYARWLSGYRSFSRFLKQAKDWKVPSEAEVPAPEFESAEADREQANAPVLHIDRYACWRIMRDGTIVFWSGDGSSIVMGPDGMRMFSSTHLEVGAAGDMRFRTGRDISFWAYRNIDFISVTGGLRIKAKTWLEGLCELGSIFLKSDRPLEMPAIPEGDPVPVEREQAVVIEGTLGNVLVHAGQDLQTWATQNNTVGSAQQTTVMSRQTVFLHAPFVRLKALSSFMLSTASATWNLLGDLKFLRQSRTVAAVGPRGLQADTVEAERVDARVALQGPKAPPNAQIPVRLAGTAQKEEKPWALEETAADEAAAWAREQIPQPDEWLGERPWWDAADSLSAWEKQRQNLTEQWIEHGGASGDYVAWYPADLTSRPAPGTRATSPVPEDDRLWWVDGGNGRLDEPSAENPASHANSTSYTRQSVVWKRMKQEPEDTP